MNRDPTRVRASGTLIERAAHDIHHVLELLLPGKIRSQVDPRSRRRAELLILSSCLIAMMVLTTAAYSRGWFSVPSGTAGENFTLTALSAAAGWIASHPLSWLVVFALLLPAPGALADAERFRQLKLAYALLAALMGCLMLYAMWAPLLDLLGQ